MKRKLYKILSAVLAVAILLPTALFFAPTANATSYPAGESLTYSYNFNLRREFCGAISEVDANIDNISTFIFYSGDTRVAVSNGSNGTITSNYYITNVVASIDCTAFYFPVSHSFAFDFTLTRGTDSETKTIKSTDDDRVLIYYNEINTYYIGSFKLPTIPDGYNFFEDSYNFGNYTSNSIPMSYFTTIYEPSSGKALYNLKKKSAEKGLCFGIAYTTAAIYHGFPSVERWTWSKLIGQETATKIRDIHNEIDPFGVRVSSSLMVFGDSGLLLNDSYIKYAFIYQWSSEVQNQLNNNTNNVSKLKRIIEDYAKSDRIGVVITIQHYEMDNSGNRKINEKGKFIPTSAHAILAVGIDGNDILVDDPNNPDNLERLTINDNLTWSYSRPWESDGINSNNSDLTFTTDTHRPYQIILTGNRTTVANGILNKETTDSNTFVDNMDRLDASNTLITFTDDIKIDGTEIVSGLSSTDIASSNNSFSTNNIVAYWVKDSNNLTVSNTSGKINEIQIANDNSLITTNINAEDKITVSNGSTTFNTSKGKDLEISFKTVYEYESFGISIHGTASSDTITASKTDTGVVIEGLNDISVSYLEDDNEISQTTVSVEDGCEVNITVDSSNNQIETDFIDKTPSDNHEKENICGYCGKIHTDTIWDMFISFIHQIISFFEKIFK